MDLSKLDNLQGLPRSFKDTRQNKLCFNFKYMPMKGDYSFDCFGKKDKGNKMIAYNDFIEKLKECGNHTYDEARSKDKRFGGAEPLPVKAIADESLRNYILSLEPINERSSLTVFRFHKDVNHKSELYRIICIEDYNYIGNMYIIAVDFKLKAYKH